MNTAHFEKDIPGKKLIVTREFNAPVEKVWKAWTSSELLDQWWAPKPWKAKTKTFDFSEGGRWHYAMVGPDGTTHWSVARFSNIDPTTSFEAQDMFSDENGAPAENPLSSHWKNEFRDVDGKTELTVTITFEKEADMKGHIEMGFEQGFTAGLNNLDALLEGSL